MKDSHKKDKLYCLLFLQKAKHEPVKIIRTKFCNSLLCSNTENQQEEKMLVRKLDLS